MDVLVRRRRLLEVGMSGIAALALGPAVSWAAGKIPTPPQAKGPFYPLHLPLDQDNDLVHNGASSATAKGVIVDVGGRLTDESGRPLAGSQIEIWQVNAYGRYHHPSDDRDLPWDPNFQGFGRTVTDADGAYRFRTIRPIAYPGRAPHIHFALRDTRFATFYTQMYLAGAAENETDFLLASLSNSKLRERLIVKLEPAQATGAELAGRFDIVLGETWLSRTR